MRTFVFIGEGRIKSAAHSTQFFSFQIILWEWMIWWKERVDGQWRPKRMQKWKNYEIDEVKWNQLINSWMKHEARQGNGIDWFAFCCLLAERVMGCCGSQCSAKRADKPKEQINSRTFTSFFVDEMEMESNKEMKKGEGRANNPSIEEMKEWVGLLLNGWNCGLWPLALCRSTIPFQKR